MKGNKFEYFTVAEAGRYTFYRIPKALFTDGRFGGLSCGAKVLYGMMLDRMGLSRRLDLASCQIDTKLKEKTSAGAIAEEMGESRKQIYRYIRLTYLLKILLDTVDAGRIPFNAGVELSYLQQPGQEMLIEVMKKADALPSLKQAAKLRKLNGE